MTVLTNQLHFDDYVALFKGLQDDAVLYTYLRSRQRRDADGFYITKHSRHELVYDLMTDPRWERWFFYGNPILTDKMLSTFENPIAGLLAIDPSISGLAVTGGETLHIYPENKQHQEMMTVLNELRDWSSVAFDLFVFLDNTTRVEDVKQLQDFNVTSYTSGKLIDLSSCFDTGVCYAMSRPNKPFYDWEYQVMPETPALTMFELDTLYRKVKYLSVFNAFYDLPEATWLDKHFLTYDYDMVQYLKTNQGLTLMSAIQTAQILWFYHFLQYLKLNQPAVTHISVNHSLLVLGSNDFEFGYFHVLSDDEMVNNRMHRHLGRQVSKHWLFGLAKLLLFYFGNNQEPINYFIKLETQTFKLSSYWNPDDETDFEFDLEFKQA